ncbi:MAG: aspartyl/asparaginyl beta-hydroxylase domain-containing protein [Gammaproteobacteria bacterium]|nr:aspartyl/asparaginyl beta-hydroxylase domain-containing protein [Gammaproteobacteria bacterium]
MNARSDTALAADERLAILLGQIERLAAAGRESEAANLLHAAEQQYPAHPLLLHERGRRLLIAGDLRGAHAVLEGLVARHPAHVPFLLSLAAALRRLERPQDELAVLERALVADPTHVVVLLQKAALLERLGKPRSAANVYANALQALPAGVRLPPAIEAHLAEARRRVAENAARVETLVESRIAALRDRAPREERLRYDRCLDRLLGRQRIYMPEPTFVLFPFLANYEYYAREHFPWLEELERRTAAVRAEALAVLAEDAQGLEPYIAYPEGLPLNQWRELNHSRRWSAYFLWNEGRRVEEHMARCPRTVEATAHAPQVDVPGRGPTAFFSILDARTRIPPHTGITNARLTVHLPLVVPPGCHFRVGGETREWREGVAWVFDDTIEHEAWNDSDLPRAILIFDVWNPQLTALERDLVRETLVALVEYHRAEDPEAAAGL